MARGRTWFAMDALFTSDPKIVKLARRHGPSAPLAYVHLLGAAKIQERGGDIASGGCRLDYLALAHGAFLKSEAQAKEILRRLVDVGLVQLVADDGEDFEVVIGNWEDYQRSDPTAAERQRRRRDKAVTTSRTTRDQPVTEFPKSRRTSTETTTELPPSGAMSEAGDLDPPLVDLSVDESGRAAA